MHSPDTPATGSKPHKASNDEQGSTIRTRGTSPSLRIAAGRLQVTLPGVFLAAEQSRSDAPSVRSNLVTLPAGRPAGPASNCRLATQQGFSESICGAKSPRYRCVSESLSAPGDCNTGAIQRAAGRQLGWRTEGSGAALDPQVTPGSSRSAAAAHPGDNWSPPRFSMEQRKVVQTKDAK